MLNWALSNYEEVRLESVMGEKVTVVENRKKIYGIFWRVVAVSYAVVLAFINLIRVFDSNFWGDECFSIRLAQMSFKNMFVATAEDVHPPLYYIFLIVAYRIGGNRGWVYHVVSTIPLFIVLGFTLTIIWKRFGKVASFLFITYWGISELAVQYNVEVRMYSWAALFVFFSYYAFFKIIKKEKYGEVLFVFCSLGAAYCHYYAMISVAFFYLALLFLVLGRKYPVKRLIGIYLATIMGYIPWLVQMVTTFKRTSEDFWMTSISSLSESLESFFSSDSFIYSWGLLIFTILGTIYVFISTKRQMDIENQKLIHNENETYINMKTDAVWMIWGLVSAFGTIFMGMAISILIRPAYIARYLYPVTPVVWFILCVLISKLKWERSIGVVVLVISLIVYFPSYMQTYREEKSENESCNVTKERLRELIDKDDILLANGLHLGWTMLDYYMPENENIMTEYGFSDFVEEKQYWLVWNNELTETEQIWLTDQQYVASEELCGGVLGYNCIHVYRLDKMK